MAITDVRQLRSLRLTERMGDKVSIQMSATLELLIINDQKNPSFAEILADTNTWPNNYNQPIPQLDDKATVNGVELIVNSRELEWYDDNERAVRMTITYAAKDDAPDQEKPTTTDPQAWKRISIQTQQMNKPAFGWLTEAAAQQGIAGQQDFARNSAGDPVDGLEEDVAMVKMVYTNTQVADPNFTKLNEYTNRCNSVDFLGGIFYTVRCLGWSGEYDQKNDVWSISVEFLYNPDSWMIEFYDVGFNEVVNNQRVAITDRRGNPVSKPVPLDGAGRAASVDTNVTGGANPVTLTNRYLYPYRAVDLRNIYVECRI